MCEGEEVGGQRVLRRGTEKEGDGDFNNASIPLLGYSSSFLLLMNFEICRW